MDDDKKDEINSKSDERSEDDVNENYNNNDDYDERRELKMVVIMK